MHVEHGRGVLWSQLLEVRVELSDLENAAPDLARRLAAVRREIDRPGGPPDAEEDFIIGAVP
jgi:hypothetical protein